MGIKDAQWMLESLGLLRGTKISGNDVNLRFWVCKRLGVKGSIKEYLSSSIHTLRRELIERVKKFEDEPK